MADANKRSGDILYHLQDIASYWSKIAKFLYRTWSRRNFVKMFNADKTRMIGLPYIWWEKKLWQYVKPFS